MNLILRKVKFINTGVSLVRADIIGDLSKGDSEIIFNLTREHFTNQLLYRKVIIFNRESAKFNYEEHVQHCLKYYNI